MRALRLLVGLLVLCWAGPWPLSATPTPTFSVSSPSANAGSPEVFTISRVAGGSGAYVLFQTHDGTAHAGVDFTTTSQLVYIKSGVSSVTVSVPTQVNPAATGNLTFTVAIASTKTPAYGTATIIEPAPPPPPPPVQCPDGSTVPAGETCPTPAPPPQPQWVNAPLVAGGYAMLIHAASGAPKYPGWQDVNYGNVYRAPTAGEVFKVDPVGPSYAWANFPTPPDQKVWTVHPLSGAEETLYFFDSDLQGVVPGQ